MSSQTTEIESKSELTLPPVNNDPISSSESPSLSEKAEEPVEEAAFKPGWNFVLAFISLSVITLMAALDATSISVALPIMAKVLGGSAIEAFWSGTSFLLTSTVFQPVLGSFSHIFGRKPLIYISLALFLAGSIIAALANNFTVILVGRSIQGIGGGGIIALTVSPSISSHLQGDTILIGFAVRKSLSLIWCPFESEESGSACSVACGRLERSQDLC